MGRKNLSSGIFGGSIILLVTINLFNALNYFFHFVMTRMLDTADYGVLAALMSIVYIFNVPSESIQTIMAKYTSQEKDSGKIKNIIRRILKKGFKIAFVLFLVYLFVAIFISKFLKIDYPLLALTGLLIFSVFLIPAGRGALQGKKRFNVLGANMILESVIRLSLAILLVYLGWRVYGAMFATFAGGAVAFVFAFYSLKGIFASEEKVTDTKEIYGYSLPVFVILFAIMTFYSLDVILAKAFFTPEVAGQYAIASILSKIILFGTLPISKAMFPISSEASLNGKQSKGILLKSLLILGSGVGIALIVTGFFPELMIRIFSGTYYPMASGVLLYLSIAMSLMSFTNLILLYKLSVGKIKNYWMTLILLVAEVILLSLFHSSLREYSITLIFLNMLFLFGSIFLFNDE